MARGEEDRMTPRARPALVLAVLLLSASAAAYQVKRSDDGLPLRWPRGAVRFQVETSPDLPLSPEHLTDVVAAAFAPWAALPGDPLDLEAGPPVADGFGYELGGANANVVRWEAHEWEYDHEALMLTFTHYRTSDGALVDADILVNGVDHAWSAGAGEAGADRFDLQSALTHEAGHFLGLAHSPDHPEATMYPSIAAGDRSRRELAGDDAAGFASLYADDPLAPQAPAGVGCAAGGRAGSLAGALALLALAAAARRRRALFGLGAAFALLTPAAAGATILRYVSVGELARVADVAVEGRVVATRAHRVGRLIVTDTTVAVDRCLRGPCATRLTVRQPGGEVDGLGLHVEGVFRARPGEALVLFLRRGAGGTFAPIGLAQGALRVQSTPRGPVAVRDLAGLVVVDRGRSRAGAVEAIPLASLRAFVVAWQR
jgi:hypothetical protein